MRPSQLPLTFLKSPREPCLGDLPQFSPWMIQCLVSLCYWTLRCPVCRWFLCVTGGRAGLHLLAPPISCCVTLGKYFKQFVSYSICISFSSSYKRGEIIPNLQWCCENWIRNNRFSTSYDVGTQQSLSNCAAVLVCVRWAAAGCCPSVGPSRQGLPTLFWVSESTKQR